MSVIMQGHIAYPSHLFYTQSLSPQAISLQAFAYTRWTN